MTSLGPFEIGRVLGVGGSSTVYAARSDANDAEIALKVLREDTAVTERERARFMDEAQRMRRVSHAALVSVLDAGFLPDGRPYVAMPLLEGESLASRITRGRLPLRDALAIFDDITSAASAVHAAGLVHRDIKPENIIITARDGRAGGTLLDLGIARDIDAPDSTTTKLGNVRGTPAYMAPERFFGKPASVASDVYEIGVTLYVMLTARLPWRSDADASERMTPMHPMRAGVVLPEPLSQAILRALAVKTDARYATADDLARAIHEAADGDAVAMSTRSTDAVAIDPRNANAPPSSQSKRPSHPIELESTTLAPSRPETPAPMGQAGSIAPPQTAPPTNRGRGVMFFVIAASTGILCASAFSVGSLWYTNAKRPPDPEPPVVAAPIAVQLAPSIPADPAPDPSTATSAIAPPSVTPAPAPPPAHNQHSAPRPSASIDPHSVTLIDCGILNSMLCSPRWQNVHGDAECKSQGLALARFAALPPAERAESNRQCKSRVQTMTLLMASLPNTN